MGAPSFLLSPVEVTYCLYVYIVTDAQTGHTVIGQGKLCNRIWLVCNRVQMEAL